MKFSCVINATPPIDTIQPITTAQINRASVTVIRFQNAACHDRCRKMSPTCSTASVTEASQAELELRQQRDR